jgi:hypothetical protein
VKAACFAVPPPEKISPVKDEAVYFEPRRAKNLLMPSQFFAVDSQLLKPKAATDVSRETSVARDPPGERTHLITLARHANND